MFFLIEQTAPGLYIFIGIALFVFFRRWLVARRDFRSTSFELERDYARLRIGGALTLVVLTIEAGLLVTGMQRVVAPTIREDREIEEQLGLVEEVVEDGPFATPTRPVPEGGPIVDPVELGEAQDLQIFVTAAPTPTPVGTIEPNYPDVIGCDSDNAFLEQPTRGLVVDRAIPVVGTAFIENFSTYKLEIKGPSTANQFRVLDEGVTPMLEKGTLSQFNPAAFEPGLYDFRLMVFDTSTTLKASCQVQIRISDPIPTPTPLGE